MISFTFLSILCFNIFSVRFKYIFLLILSEGNMFFYLIPRIYFLNFKIIAFILILCVENPIWNFTYRKKNKIK